MNCPHELDPSRLKVLEEMKSTTFARIRDLTKAVGKLDPNKVSDPAKRDEVRMDLAAAEAELESAREDRDEIGILYAACEKALRAE